MQHAIIGNTATRQHGNIVCTLALMVAAALSPLAADARAVVEIRRPGELDSEARAQLEALQALAASRPDGRTRVMLGLRTPTLKPTPADILATRELLLQAADENLREPLAAARRYDNFAFLAAQLSAAHLEALAANPHISFIEEEAESGGVLLTDVIPLLNADDVHSDGVDGSGQVIAIIDTGVKSNATGLSGKVVSEGCYSTAHGTYGSWCYGGAAYGSTATNSGREGVGYFSYHGTYVAGNAVANNAAGYGVAKSANLISLQVVSFGDDGEHRITESDLVGALDRVYALRTTYDIAAVNMSIFVEFTYCESTCDSEFPGLVTAIGDLVDAGIAVVAAAGNNAVNGMLPPACISHVISVAGVDKDDAVWGYTAASSGTKLMAVSGKQGSQQTDQIYTTGMSGYEYSAPGTSLASPQVAGAIALLREVAPGGSPASYLNQLQSTGVLKSVTRGGANFSIPRIDVEAAAATPSTPGSLNVTSESCFGYNSVDWSASSGPVTQYILEGSASSSFTPPVVNYYTGSLTDAFINVSGTTYLRVRACNGIVCSSNKVAAFPATYTAGCM